MSLRNLAERLCSIGFREEINMHGMFNSVIGYTIRDNATLSNIFKAMKDSLGNFSLVTRFRNPFNHGP